MVELLGDILKGLSTSTVKTCGFLSLWQEVVDKRVSRQTEAIKIRNRVLYVRTSSSAWAQELTFLKSEFIRKFNEIAGIEVIRDIKFKAGG